MRIYNLLLKNKVAFSNLIICLITIRLPFASTTLHIREDLHSQTSLFSISLINTEVLLILLMGMYNIACSSSEVNHNFVYKCNLLNVC